MSRIWKILTRKKAIDPVTVEETRLSRVLNVFDLTALGVGSTLGVGVYVLAGQVAKTTAGPSVVLSFLIAAVASVFAGLCYAEFGARAPRAGSAYIYSYVCVGEFIAFVIGWNLILEYVIGSASVARGLSVYLDTLINNTLQDTFREIAPMNVAYLASYFDFFSFGISVLLSVGLAFGLKESSMVNNIVTCLNVLVVLFIVIAGSLKANPSNWHLSSNNTDANSTITGDGGFFPWGVSGMIKGAATCFYGFVGFDCIATTGEEVKNPRKAIPISIVLSLFIIFLAYFGVATVLTLMVPYYQLDAGAPIPKAFELMGWNVAKWIVAIGALFGLCASLFGAMFPLPRIIYAMGSDGLVFKFLAKVHPKFQTPVIGTILAGVLTGLMSALFDLSQLVNMMSIGTLQAYTIVAASVLLLRYKEEAKKLYIQVKTCSDTESVSSEGSLDDKYNDDRVRQNFDGPTTSDEQELLGDNSSSFCHSLNYIINFRIKEPTRITEGIVAVEVLLYCLLCVGISLCAIYLTTNMANGEIWSIVVTTVIVGLAVIVLLSLATQPKSKKELSFKVPLVPLIPALSILVNIYLMLMLDYMTWVRFAVWMAVGIPMYYVCACTKKPPPKPQNGSNYCNNITNGLGNKLNGISNPGFVRNESNGQEMKQTKRKAAAPPPPTILEQNETIEVEQEAVIAQLDEILEKEAVISQLDDVLNNETVRINDRKLSAGTLSNMSAVASRSEDVVADVHCANVVTPVVDPESIPFPSPHPFNHKSTAMSESQGSIHNVSGNFAAETMKQSDENCPSLYPNASSINKLSENNLGGDEEVILNDNKTWSSVDERPENKLEESLQTAATNIISAVHNFQNLEEESYGNEGARPPELSNDVAFPSDNPMGKGLDKSEETILNDENPSESPNVDETLETKLEQSSQNVADEIPVAPSFQNFESATLSKADNANKSPPTSNKTSPSDSSNNDPVVSSPIPTEEALKTVTLRHVKKQIKEIEPVENQMASDDNLKIGSSEYKNFIKDLDSKLKRLTVIPTFYVAPRKNLVVPPKPVVPNENVVEEAIDRSDAKEKLKQFYAKKNNLEEIDLSRSESSKQLYGSKSVDESLVGAHLSNPTENSRRLSESGLEDPVIKLKHLEAKDDEHLIRRLSKSLGSSFTNDDSIRAHKLQMDELFKTIKSMRKDSIENNS